MEPFYARCSNSSKTSMLKKSITEYFVWTDDEVELLIKIAVDYKVTKTSENVDFDILHVFLRSIYLQKK